MVQGGGFEPPKLARQIYSLIPLATREPLRKAADIIRLRNTCCQADSSKNSQTYDNNLQIIGADERSRTPDRLITSQLLYLLSYVSSPTTN